MSFQRGPGHGFGLSTQLPRFRRDRTLVSQHTEIGRLARWYLLLRILSFQRGRGQGFGLSTQFPCFRRDRTLVSRHLDTEIRRLRNGLAGSRVSTFMARGNDSLGSDFDNLDTWPSGEKLRLRFRPVSSVG